MNRATALVPVMLCAALTSCAPDQRSKENEPAPAECTAVTAKADTLTTMTGRLVAGNATVNQVRSAAEDLVNTANNTTATTPAANRALRRVETAATTHPVDTQALRDATGDLLTALDNTPNLCEPSTEDPTSS